MTKKRSKMASDIGECVKSLIENDAQEPTELFHAEFPVEDIWDEFKDKFNDTQLVDPKLFESNNLFQQYNIPENDDAVPLNDMLNFLKDLGLEALPNFDIRYIRTGSACSYLAVSVNKDNIEKGVDYIHEKIKFLSDNFEFKAYLKGAKLFKLEIPDNRVIIGSYIHVYYGDKLDETSKIMDKLHEQQILLQEGAMPIHLED